jgi:hypothetical protein
MRPFLISQIILLPIIAGLVRFRRLDRQYQPFFILLCIGEIAEIANYVQIHTFHQSNAVIVSIFTLLEWTLIAWQFHRWGFLEHRVRLFYGLLVFTTLCWVTDNLVFGGIHTFSPNFRFLYYFLIVLLSINKINFMITHENRGLLRDPRFLICVGLIIYFMYMIVYYWALSVSTYDKTITTTSSVLYLMAYVNALANTIYAIAFLLLPAPTKFTLK